METENTTSISHILDGVLGELRVDIRFCNSFDEADDEIKSMNTFITNIIEERNYNHPLIRIYSIPCSDRFIVVVKHLTNDHHFDEDFQTEVDAICSLLAKLTYERCQMSSNMYISNIFNTSTEETFHDEIQKEWKTRISTCITSDCSSTMTEVIRTENESIEENEVAEDYSETLNEDDKIQDCGAIPDEYEIKASALADNKEKFDRFVLVSKLYKGLIECQNKYQTQLESIQHSLYNLRNEMSDDFGELHRLLSDYGDGQEENFNYTEYSKCPSAYEVYMKCGRCGIPIDCGSIYDLSNGDYGMGSKSIIVIVNYKPIENGYEYSSTPLTLHYDYSGCIVWEHPERVPYPFEEYQREEDYTLKMKLRII